MSGWVCVADNSFCLMSVPKHDGFSMTSSIKPDLFRLRSPLKKMADDLSLPNDIRERAMARLRDLDRLEGRFETD